MICALPVLHSRWLKNVISALRKKLDVEGRLFNGLGHLLTMLDSAAQFLKNRYLFSGLTLGLLAWGAEGYAFWIILEYLQLDVPVHIAIGIYSLSVLAGAISFLPGGLGGTEAIMGLMMIWQGADTPTAIAATLVCRIATLWFAVVIGAGAFLAAERVSPSAPASEA